MQKKCINDIDEKYMKAVNSRKQRLERDQTLKVMEIDRIERLLVENELPENMEDIEFSEETVQD